MATNPWSPQLQLSVCNFSISPYPFYLCNDDKCHVWPPCRTDPRPSATDRKLPKPRRGANQNQLWQRRYAIHNFLIPWIHTHARKQKTDWSGNTIRSISSQRIQRTIGKKSSIQQPSWRKIDLLWLLRRKSLQATLMTVSIPRRRSASSAAAQQHFPAERIKLWRRQGKCQMAVEKPKSSHIMPILLENIFRFPKDPKVCQRPQASRIDEDPKAAPPHHAKRRA